MSNQQLVDRAMSASVAWVQAENMVREAKYEYHAALEDFFTVHGRPEGTFSRDNEAFIEVIDATAPHYQALQKAKRKGYNARRRLRTAVDAYLKAGGAHEDQG